MNSLRARTLFLISASTVISKDMLNVGKAWALESKGSKQIDAVSAVEQNHNLSAPLLQWIDSSILIYSVFYT